MKLFKQILLSLLAVSAIGTASAAPIAVSVDEAFNTASVAIVSTGTPYSFIISAGSAFTAQFDELTEGSLFLRLSDPLQGNEKYTFIIGTGPDAQQFTRSGNNNVNNGNHAVDHEVVLNAHSLALLNEDGFFKVFLKVSNGGNYSFHGATLVAEGVSGKVPEPLTLALMGIALAGVGAARRRK